ncbi:hypothetical protein Trydic_g17540, partial [Trypoxylus dichotomus]
MEPEETIQQTPGSESDRGRKYELSVAAFIASSLSQNENVEDYRIYSNLRKYQPFDDVVVEVHFKESKGSQIYAIQTKSGNYKFHINKYLEGYRVITKEICQEKIHFWHFSVKNIEYLEQQFFKNRHLKGFACKEPSNTDSKHILDKKSFEHELLRNRLYNYVVTPTKAIRFQHKAVDEWNRLTLTRDVTLVLNEKHTEEYIYGCMLQHKHISDIINIDQWNRFVENEETLKDLIFQRWVDGKIPLILRIDAWLPALKELLYLNKKYIAIVSDIAGRSAEIESNQLKVFRHLGDAETEELTKNIPVSLQ